MPLGFVSLLPLVLVALAAAPLLLAAPKGAPRRLVAGGLSGLLLAHAGLFLLYWSTWVCWGLVALAALAVALAAFPRRPALAALAALVPALVLGLAFELDGTDVGLVLYVASAVPILLGVPLAALASSWLRWDASRPALAALVGLALFAGLVPFTSFWPQFLLTFEPAHLAPLSLALLALLLLARRLAPARDAALSSETLADFAAREHVPWRAARVLLALAAGAAGLAALGDASGPDAPMALALGIALLGLAALSWKADPRRLVPASVAALAAAGLVAGLAALDLHVDGEGGAWRLLVASLAASALLVALGLSLAAWQDEAGRARALDARFAGVPQGALVSEGPPTREAILALRERVRREKATLGILRTRAPLDEPFWTLPDDAYEALLAPGPRVHVAILEGGEVSHVPPLVEAPG